MSQQEVEADLEGLPPSNEIVVLCADALPTEVLEEIRDLELKPVLAFGCLWIELEKAGTDPEKFFQEKGIIQ